MPTPEETIRDVAPMWRWGGRGPIWDPIDMESKVADQVQKELTVVRLETGASLFRSLADGFAKASHIISGSRATD